MIVKDKIKSIENKNAILTTENITAQGISKADFYKYVKEYGYEKIAHGVYARPDILIDESYLLHMRCPRAVFSHDEALYYHRLVDREPMQQTITIYTGYNTKRLTESGVKAFTVKKELLEIGKIEVKNSYGNRIPMYDLERTICDLMRSRSQFEIQDFQTALKTYIRRTDKDLNRLMRYAELFHVNNILRKYMEVLL
ncbi:MAG: abortive phage infection protein [Lachnospiraceae bacterium]|nr:abortive phage infection protein [Lachnospiraceae bacterium]